MSAHSTVLLVRLVHDGLSEEDLAAETALLATELSEAGAVPVRTQTSPPPSGAKAGDLAVLGVLTYSIVSSPEMFTAVLTLVRDWLGARTARRVTRVRIEINGDSLEIDRATDDEQSDLVQAFINHHNRR